MNNFKITSINFGYYTLFGGEPFYYSGLHDNAKWEYAIQNKFNASGNTFGINILSIDLL